MIKRTSCILLIVILILFSLSGCKQQKEYEWQAHKWEDMLSLFEEQTSMFQETADIFSTNKRFWEECRQYDDDTKAWLMSPYDEEKMGVFSSEEQEIITRFFEQTRPYMIYVYNEELVQFDYINETDDHGFSLVYYYGNAREAWVDSQNNNAYHISIIDLGNNWFTY